MAESTLNLDYSDLMNLVGHFLYGEQQAEMSTEHERQADNAVQAGYRGLLYPKAAPGIEAGYEWSFLQHVATITTVADAGDQDLPDNFGRLINGFTFAANAQKCPVVADVGEGKIRHLRSSMSETGEPRVAGIKYNATYDGTESIRKQVLWYPTPDDAYELSYRYEVQMQRLTEANPYPVGGLKHAETLRLSCLAAAEAIENDGHSTHRDDFIAALAASIKRDKAEAPKFYGRIGRRRDEGSVDPDTYYGNYSLRVSGVDIQT